MSHLLCVCVRACVCELLFTTWSRLSDWRLVTVPIEWIAESREPSNSSLDYYVYAEGAVKIAASFDVRVSVKRIGRRKQSALIRECVAWLGVRYLLLSATCYYIHSLCAKDRSKSTRKVWASYAMATPGRRLSASWRSFPVVVSPRGA